MVSMVKSILVILGLDQWFPNWGRDSREGRLPSFWRSRELLIKIFIIISRFYISYMEPLFILANIIGSSGKNESLLFHSKLFKM